jgi:DNA polymerase
MFVGEGPGETEDAEGRPFVGKAGALLNEALRLADIEREAVFITNVVKCRPPGNRNPSQEEMTSCSPYLFKQIEVIKPGMIVLLGKVASEFLLQRPVKITKENGKLDFLPSGTCVMPVLHPAYVLRNHQPEVRASFFRAIQDARNIAYGNSDPGLHA